MQPWRVVSSAPHIALCHGCCAPQGSGACVAGPGESDYTPAWLRVQGWKGQPQSARSLPPVLLCQGIVATGSGGRSGLGVLQLGRILPPVEGKAARGVEGGGRRVLADTIFPPPQNMLRRQEELENGTAWSISSESSDDSSSPQLSGSARHAAHKPIVQPEVQASAPAIEISFSQQPEEAGAGAGGVCVPPAGSQPEELGSRKKDAVANGHVPYSRTLSHISEASVDATMEAKAVESPWEPAPSLEDMGTGEQDADPLPGAPVAAAAAGQDRGAEAKPRATAAWATTCEVEAGGDEPVQSQAPSQGSCGTGVTAALAQAPSEERPIPAPPLAAGVPEVPRAKVVDSGLEEAIGLLGSALDDYRGQFPELQPLERELKHLEEMLLVRGSQQCLGMGRTGLSLLAVPRGDGDRAVPAGSDQG